MLWAINSQTGSQIWTFVTGTGCGGDNEMGCGGPLSAPSIGPDGTIYLGSFYNGIYAIDPAMGNQKWFFPDCEGTVSTPAIGTDGTLYVGCNDKNVYAIKPDGTKKWAYLTGGIFDGSPAIGGDGTVYIGSSDENVYAISSTGILKWAFKTLGGILSSPAIDTDGTVYIGSEGMYALSAAGPTATATATGVPTATATSTATSTKTATATATATYTPTATATPTPTETPIETPTTPIVGVCGTVTVTSVGTTSGKSGDTVVAGSFAIQNICPHALIISAVHVTETDARLFSALALKATIDGHSHTSRASSASTATFNFSPTLAVPGGHIAFFNLSATMADTAGVSTLSDQELTGVDAIIDAHPTIVSPLPDDLGNVTLTIVPIVPRVTPPQQLVFPSTKVSKSSGTKPVTMTNPSKNQSLGFNGSPFAKITCNATPCDFQFGPTANTCPNGIIPPRKSCAFNLVFVPKAKGLRKGTVTIFDNTPSGPHTVTLQGVGK